MKKLIINLITYLFIILVSFIIILSTLGIETKKFNKIISKEMAQRNNIYLDLNVIKYKLDIQALSLFLETKNPAINYNKISIPVKNIKVYVDFLSLVKSNLKIRKADVILDELNITQLNELTPLIKPSNFKTLLNNKIQDGKLICEIEIFLNEEGSFKNFIAKGNVKNLKAEVINGFILTETNFSFFADKTDILIKNIFGSLEGIKISDGDVKLNLEKEINIISSFNSKIDLNKKNDNKYLKFLKNFNLDNEIKDLKADLKNNFSIKLDETYKIKDYNLNSSGSLYKGKLNLSEPFKNDFINEEIKEIYFSDFQTQIIFDPRNIIVNGNGKYSFDNLNFFKINLTNILKSGDQNLKLDFEYKNSLELNLINYKKSKDSVAKIFLDLKKNRNNIKINKLYFNEGNNSIKIDDLSFKKNKFLSFKKIEVTTKHNNFFISNDKKISIKGSKFDATNLPKLLKNQKKEKGLKELNGEIEIDLKKIKVPMSEKIENFKLIGKISEGKFEKISSKGDFGGGNYLDMSLKKDKKVKKIFRNLFRFNQAFTDRI